MALVPAGGARMLDRVPDRSQRLVTFAAGAPVLLALGVATAVHAGVFRDPRTLWTDTLANNPESWMAHNNLGLLLKDEDGNTDGAMAHYRESLRLNPNPEAHTNLGLALAGEGQLDQAVSHYRSALQLDPRFPAAHHDLGLALTAQGRIDEAIGEFREAVRPPANYTEAHYALGL